MRIQRATFSLSSAAFVTLILFFFMAGLLLKGEMKLDEDIKTWEFEILPQIEEVEPKTKKFKPKRFTKPVPPPKMVRHKPVTEEIGSNELLHLVKYHIGEDVLNEGHSSGGALPMYQPAPFYPIKARRDQVEGYVIVTFTVTAMGTVKDIKIHYAEPVGYFEKAVLAAAKKLRYSPSGIPGKTPDKKNVKLRYSFRLDA